MGRQFRFYLLPVDADQLLNELKREHGLKIVSSTSSNTEAVELASATNDYTLMAAGMFTFGQCLLARDAKTKTPMWFNERQTKWHIDFERSETIQFSTCDYGAGMLRQGRFYYQKDMLSPSSDAILLKSADFIAWAERIFQTAKKLLRYSRELEAYIGQEADIWRREGGKLITGFRPGNIPIYPDTHN